MLFGVVTVVFLFFSAFLLAAFTEDDIMAGAGMMRPKWEENTNKNYTVDIGRKAWMNSLEFLLYCLKFEYFNSSLISCNFYFFLSLSIYEVALLHRHRCGGRGKPRGSGDGGDTWRNWFDFWVSGQAPASLQSFSHVKLFYPDRIKSSPVLWTAYVVQPVREGSQICRNRLDQAVLKSNCIVNIACQRSCTVCGQDFCIWIV